MSGYMEVDGERLRELRRARALSQRELAEMVGSIQATISALEQGHRKAQPRTVRHLAEVLGVEPRELLRL